MKKWLLILGMITCMAGLTACGGKEAVEGFMTPETAETYATENIAAMNQVVMQGAQAQVTDPVWTAALDSWETASEEMGSYVEVISVTSSFDDKDGTIDAVIKGTDRNAVVEFVFDNQAITGISVNVEYTFGEKMEKAALNTLLGMGTVFVVLILISLIIYCFRFISVIQNKAAGKGKKNEAEAGAVVEQIGQREEQLTDDLELVAVISAAVAASTGASADSFVVRSIRRR